MLVADVCQRYLDHARRENAAETYRLRADFRFDFCSGFAASLREQPDTLVLSRRQRGCQANEHCRDESPRQRLDARTLALAGASDVERLDCVLL